MKKVLLAGAGPMAVEYARVLAALGAGYTVVGRGDASAARFEAETGRPVLRGGVEACIADGSLAEYGAAIVAVSSDLLGAVSRRLMEAGVRKILVEKPGGLTEEDIRETARAAAETGSRVFVAYNRRCYASVRKAREMIREEGGVRSFHFEFTEWGHVIRPLLKAPGVKEEWFLANSSHVADMAFYLGGRPKDMQAYTAGTSDWHPRAMIYAGSGVSENGALFSYQANWGAPGRWSVEVLTDLHRFIFRPLEKLQIQEIGSVAVNFAELDDTLDLEFKAGLHAQLTEFLREDCGLWTIEAQCAMLPVYHAMEYGGHFSA
jgi:predicted dehydrogenase